MLDDVIFIIFFFIYITIPGLIISIVININKYKLNIFEKICLIPSLSIGTLSIFATITTSLGLSLVYPSFILVSSLLLASLLFVINKEKFRLFFVDILSLNRKDLYMIVSLLLMGVVVSVIIYAGLTRHAINPYNNDVIDHQTIVEKISTNKNVSLKSVTTLPSLFTPQFYPYGFHILSSLLYQLGSHTNRTAFLTSVLFTSFLPLSLFQLTYSLFKSRRIALFSSLIAISYGFFPFFAYGWGGFPLTMSLIILPIFILLFYKLSIHKKFDPGLITIASILAVSLFFVHISELIIISPILICLLIFSRLIKINKILVMNWSGLFVLFIFLLAPIIGLLFKQEILGDINKNSYDPSELGISTSTLKDKLTLINITKFNESIQKVSLSFKVNQNEPLLVLFMLGLFGQLTIIRSSRYKKELLFIILGYLIFVILIIDSSTLRILEPIYNLMPWSSWERLSYVQYVFISIISALSVRLVNKSQQKIFIIVCAVLLLKPIYNSYLRLSTIAPTLSTITADEWLAFEWIDNNIPRGSMFLNYYRGLGTKESSLWLPVYTDSNLVFPIQSPLHIEFQKVMDQILNSLTQNDSPISISDIINKYDAKYFIISESSGMYNNLPIAAYANKNPCLKLIYPKTEVIKCTTYVGEDGKSQNALDIKETYIFKYQQDCDNISLLCKD